MNWDLLFLKSLAFLTWYRDNVSFCITVLIGPSHFIRVCGYFPTLQGECASRILGYTVISDDL